MGHVAQNGPSDMIRCFGRQRQHQKGMVEDPVPVGGNCWYGDALALESDISYPTVQRPWISGAIFFFLFF